MLASGGVREDQTRSSRWYVGGSDVTTTTPVPSSTPLSSHASWMQEIWCETPGSHSMAVREPLNHLTESQLGTLLDCDARER